MLLRLELLTPEADLMMTDIFNRVFTMHGTTMVYLFILPAMLGVLGSFLLPLVIGARNMAFPRLNLLTFYIFAGGAMLTILLAAYGGIDTGWTFYPPYSTTFSVTPVPAADYPYPDCDVCDDFVEHQHLFHDSTATRERV